MTGLVLGLLSIVGIIVAVFAVVSGFFSGELDRMSKDPELRKWIEEERKEKERQKAWKNKLK